MLPPHYNLLSSGSQDPGEAAVVVVFSLGVDGDSISCALGQERVEIVHDVVDHEACRAGVEVFRVAGEDAPNGAIELRSVPDA